MPYLAMKVTPQDTEIGKPRFFLRFLIGFPHPAQPDDRIPGHSGRKARWILIAPTESIFHAAHGLALSSASPRLTTADLSGFPPPPRQHRARLRLSLALLRFPASLRVRLVSWFSSPAGLQHEVKGPPERKTCGEAAIRTKPLLRWQEQHTEEYGQEIQWLDQL